MAKLYKVRKKCLICNKVFYPKYAGSMYCDDCKNKKKAEKKKKANVESEEKRAKKLLDLLKKK